MGESRTVTVRFSQFLALSLLNSGLRGTVGRHSLGDLKEKINIDVILSILPALGGFVAQGLLIHGMSSAHEVEQMSVEMDVNVMSDQAPW